MPEVIPGFYRNPEVVFGMSLNIDLGIEAILTRFQKK
jgi:hypothetical protein